MNISIGINTMKGIEKNQVATVIDLVNYINIWLVFCGNEDCFSILCTSYQLYLECIFILLSYRSQVQKCTDFFHLFAKIS